MRRLAILLAVLLVAPVVTAGAQESAEDVTEEAAAEPGQYIVTDLGVGFPTTLGAGLYWANPYFELPMGILSGWEFTVCGGLGMKAPETFAKDEQQGLVGEGMMMDYYAFPAEGLDINRHLVFGFRSYLRAVELDLGFATLPISTGTYFGFGSIKGGEDAKYAHFDMMVSTKVELRLEAFKLLKPYIELGIGGGSAWPSNDEAKLAISGYSEPQTMALAGTEEYARWYNSQWEYTHLLLNAGVRFELAPFWGKKQEKEEPEEEPEPEVDTRVSEFLFPEWLMELGGLTYRPEDVMSGVVIIGPQKFFRKYSFKHQSTVRGDQFKHKYEPDDIVEIIQSDDEIYHARFTTEEGEEIEYKLYRLSEGQQKTIEGETIEPITDGLYYDGKVFTTISPSDM